MSNIIKTIFKLVLILLFLFFANIASSFILGFLSSLGSNFATIGLNQLNFNPLTTIAYILLYYFITLFYQPENSAQFKLFLFTLFLSFTVNFIQGSIFLIFFYFLLRKAKMI